MIKQFRDNPTIYTRALQIWQVLIAKAENRQTMTYGALADAIRVGGAQVIGMFLGPIMRYCQENELPPLTVLVVNSQTGEPGPGLTSINQLNVERESVFKYDWYGLIPPTPGEFEEIHKRSQQKTD